MHHHFHLWIPAHMQEKKQWWGSTWGETWLIVLNPLTTAWKYRDREGHSFPFAMETTNRGRQTNKQKQRQRRHALTWWARQMRSISCLWRNLVTTSAPKVKETPRSFSPHPSTSLSGSAHSRSHSRPWSGTSVGRMTLLTCSMDWRSGDRPAGGSSVRIRDANDWLVNWLTLLNDWIEWIHLTMKNV